MRREIDSAQITSPLLSRPLNSNALTVTTTPKAWPWNHELASATCHVRAALGLHPQLVAKRAREIGLWEKLLPQTRYFGEVGLDAGPRFYKSFETQKEIFCPCVVAVRCQRRQVRHDP
ncbi:MAG: TatD family hydrolase [Mesorhizobium sp.]